MLVKFINNNLSFAVLEVWLIQL